MPKIVIKPPPPPVESDIEDVVEENGSEADAVDAEGEEDTQDAEMEDNTTYATPAPYFSGPVKRPRGRPKGSGKKVDVPHVPRSRGRPRGRGRAPPRASITLKLPKRVGDYDSDAEESGVEMDEEPKEKVLAVGPGNPTRKVLGELYLIQGDELVTPDNPKGDEKIDKWGSLLGGRKFKANTFLIPNRHPSRLYMLAIDAARTSGFRDSLYYFRKNPLAFKLNATSAEKDYLINQGNLGSHLRTRSVTLITARSAFKLHGSKMVVNGRWVTDDYYEDRVLAEIAERDIQPGDLVGDLPDPNADRAAVDASRGDRGAAQAGGGSGLGMYRAGGPTTIFGGEGYGPFSDGPLNAVRKSILSRDGVTEENWMLLMAHRASESGSEWSKLRKAALKATGGPSILNQPEVHEEAPIQIDEQAMSEDPASIGRKLEDTPAVGAYEPHTGIVLYREDTQPTRSRMEKIPDDSRIVLGGSKAGNAAWGLAWVDTVMELDFHGNTVNSWRPPPTIETIDLTRQ